MAQDNAPSCIPLVMDLFMIYLGKLDVHGDQKPTVMIFENVQRWLMNFSKMLYQLQTLLDVCICP